MGNRPHCQASSLSALKRRKGVPCPSGLRRWLFDAPKLEWKPSRAGFTDIRIVNFHEGDCPDLDVLEATFGPSRMWAVRPTAHLGFVITLPVIETPLLPPWERISRPVGQPSKWFPVPSTRSAL
jgi:hypothetical protein